MQKENIKLIALDMDGTTLNKGGHLTDRTKGALLSAMKKGIHVVIATGRVLSAFPKEVLCMPGIEYAVSSNGARVVRLEDQSTIYTNLIDPLRAKALMPHIFADDLFLEIFYDGDVFVEKECVDRLESYNLPQRYTEYMLSTRTQISNLRRAMEEHIDGLENLNINFGSQERKAELWEIITGLYGLTATSSFPHNIEIGGETTSKADGVSHLCKILNLSKENVMACGDSYNDLAMLKFANFSVAVENAEEDIKKQVDFVTKSNEEDGVAYAIETYIL